MSDDDHLQSAEKGLKALALGSLDFSSKFEEGADACVAGECVLNVRSTGFGAQIEVRPCPQYFRRQIEEELPSWHKRSLRLRGFEPIPNSCERQHESRVSSEVISRQFRDLPNNSVSKRIQIRSEVSLSAAIGTRQRGTPRPLPARWVPTPTPPATPPSLRPSERGQITVFMRASVNSAPGQALPDNTAGNVGNLSTFSTRNSAAHILGPRLVKIGGGQSGFAHVCRDEGHGRELAKTRRAPFHLLNQIHFVSPSLPAPK